MRKGVVTLGVITFMLPAAASAAACPSLSRGMSGADVSTVQKVLFDAYVGFPEPTGYFGAVTEAALKQWQSEHGLESVGFVGPKTATAMNLCTASVVTTSTTASTPNVTASVNTNTPTLVTATRTLSRGLSGSDVFALQQFLVAQKLLSPDSATGYFGALTEAAVQTFQRANNLVSSGSAATTGYGAVGPRTRIAIANTTNLTPSTAPISSPTTPTKRIESAPSTTVSTSKTTQASNPWSTSGGSSPARTVVSAPTTFPTAPSLPVAPIATVPLSPAVAPTPVMPSPPPSTDVAHPQPSDPTNTATPEGYYLVKVSQVFGNCSDQGYYGADPDLPCNNWNRFYPKNTIIPAYRSKLTAKKGDIFRVEAQVTTTNDGNLGYLVELEGIACATAKGISIPRDPITGNIDPFWANQMLADCPLSIRPKWMQSDPLIAPDGTQARADSSTAVAQLLAKDSSGQHLLGARARQEHGIDWTNNRGCTNFPGENCRGHMSETVSGLYTATADGDITFEIQVADIAGADLKRFSLEAGGGQIIVEQYRKSDSSATVGYGLGQILGTRAQQITQYGQASCPGHDQETITNHPDDFSVFKLSTQANAGDIVRTFSRAIGRSITTNDSDAMALGIWRSSGSGGPLTFVSKAWALYGNSYYFPLAMMYAEGVDTITSAGSRLYRTTLHSSDTPTNCDSTSVIAPPDATTAYGGKVQPNTGEMDLMRFVPRADNATSMLLRSAKEYKTPVTSTVAVDDAWHTLFQDSFTTDASGAIRAWSQVGLLNMNVADTPGTIQCSARILIDTALASGETVNSGFNAYDNVYLVTHLINTISTGSHRFQTQVRCSAGDGKAHTMQVVADGAYGSLEVFTEGTAIPAPPPTPILSITANGVSTTTSVAYNTPATIAWNASGVQGACTVAGPTSSDLFEGNAGTSGTKQTPALTQTSFYFLSCVRADNGQPISSMVRVDMTSVPTMSLTINGSADRNVSVPKGTAATLVWDSNNNYGCSLSADGGFSDGSFSRSTSSGTAQTPVYTTVGASYSYTFACWPSASATAPIAKTITVNVTSNAVSQATQTSNLANALTALQAILAKLAE